jgi:hypothetical protein
MLEDMMVRTNQATELDTGGCYQSLLIVTRTGVALEIGTDVERHAERLNG